VRRVCSAGITPEAPDVFGCGLLALVLLSFTLATGYLDALAYLLGFVNVYRLTATPGVCDYPSSSSRTHQRRCRPDTGRTSHLGFQSCR